MEITKSNMTIIRDSREQNTLVFQKTKIEIGTLQTGDYSLKGFENQISIERKSLQDQLLSLGVDRERFMREIQRLKAFEYCSLVIESSLSMLNSGNWRSKITPQSVVRSLLRLSVGGLHVVWAENSQMAARVVEGLLYQFLRKKAGEVERIMPFISMN